VASTKAIHRDAHGDNYASTSNTANVSKGKEKDHDHEANPLDGLERPDRLVFTLVVLTGFKGICATCVRVADVIDSLFLREHALHELQLFLILAKRGRHI